MSNKEGGVEPLNLGVDFYVAKADTGHLANGGPLLSVLASVLALRNRKCEVAGSSSMDSPSYRIYNIDIAQPGAVYSQSPITGQVFYK